MVKRANQITFNKGGERQCTTFNLTTMGEDMFIINNKRLLSGILFSGIIILNNGCALKKYFVPHQDELQRQQAPVVIIQEEVVSPPPPPTTTTVIQQTPPPTTIYYEPQTIETSQESNPIIEASIPVVEAECNDNVPVIENNCNRGEITQDELQEQNIQQTQEGTMHLLKSVQGKTISIGERPNGFVFPNYPGKVIILEMFGKDCPHCLKEIPIIKRIKKRYRGKVEVIAIQSQGRMSDYAARSYINKHRINYPIIEGSDATNLQYFIQNTYGWTGILPYTLVIKDGVTEFSYPGEVSYNELKKDIDSLM